MDTARHAVQDLNTTESPLNTGLRQPPTPLSLAQKSCEKPVEFLTIALNTSRNTSAPDRLPQCFGDKYTQIAAQYRSIHPLYTLLITVADTITPALNYSNFGFFPIDFFGKMRFLFS